MPNKPFAASENLNRLIAFRQVIYACLGAARDALFELGDAVLLSHTPMHWSLAALSLTPVFRRRWPSVYEALQDARLDSAALLQQYAAQVRPGEAGYVLLAGDHTAWPRPYTRTLRERTVEHQPNPVPGGRPTTIGLGFSTLSWVPEARGSWALPLLHQRIPCTRTPIQQMVQQIMDASQQLQAQQQAPAVVLLDAQYGCRPFHEQLIAAQAYMHGPCYCLARLRSNLVLYTAPPPYHGHGPSHGRPRVHGRKFRLADARTWGLADETLEVHDPSLGLMRIRRWAALHIRQVPRHPFTALLIERIQARGTRRDPHALWVAWLGPDGVPPGLTLAQAWPLYFRRFALDHWYRFAKHTLGWTRPQLRTPEQAQCWSDLMALITWELWLARPLVTDQPLPWQKSQPSAALTPGRVRQSLAALFAAIGTPAQAPKPRGKSPGWPTGRPRTKAERYPLVRKTLYKGTQRRRKRPKP